MNNHVYHHSYVDGVVIFIKYIIYFNHISIQVSMVTIVVTNIYFLSFIFVYYGHHESGTRMKIMLENKYKNNIQSRGGCSIIMLILTIICTFTKNYI